MLYVTLLSTYGHTHTQQGEDGAYICECPPGFTGDQCSTQVRQESTAQIVGAVTGSLLVLLVLVPVLVLVVLCLKFRARQLLGK